MATQPINRKLAQAITAGDGAAVLQLLEEGANPNTSVGGMDMLFRAWKSRRQQIFQVLVEHGARMHGKRKDRELIYLARTGWLELLADGVRRGWPLECQAPETLSDMRTPVAELVRKGNTDGLMMLHGIGVDIRKSEIDRVRAPGRWSCTMAVALREGTRNKDVLEDTIRVLAPYEPCSMDDCRDVGKEMGRVITIHEKDRVLIERLLGILRDSPWWQPAVVASMATRMAHMGQEQALIRQLIEEMPQITQDKYEGGLLQAALAGCRSARCKDPSDSLATVHLLLDKGADPNERYLGMTHWQHFILGYGKRSDHDLVVLEALGKAGARMGDLIEPMQEHETMPNPKPHSVHWHGSSVAHILAWDIPIIFGVNFEQGAQYLRQVIAQHPEMLHQKNPDGMTPIHSLFLPRSCAPILATSRECLPVMRMLIHEGADLTARWKGGNHLLHAIASAWKQGLKPKDGDAALETLYARAPQLWDMENDNGISGREAIQGVQPPGPRPGPR